MNIFKTIDNKIYYSVGGPESGSPDEIEIEAEDKTSASPGRFAETIASLADRARNPYTPINGNSKNLGQDIQENSDIPPFMKGTYPPIVSEKMTSESSEPIVPKQSNDAEEVKPPVNNIDEPIDSSKGNSKEDIQPNLTKEQGHLTNADKFKTLSEAVTNAKSLSERQTAQQNLDLFLNKNKEKRYTTEADKDRQELSKNLEVASNDEETKKKAQAELDQHDINTAAEIYRIRSEIDDITKRIDISGLPKPVQEAIRKQTTINKERLAIQNNLDQQLNAEVNMSSKVDSVKEKIANVKAFGEKLKWIFKGGAGSAALLAALSLLFPGVGIVTAAITGGIAGGVVGGIASGNLNLKELSKKQEAEQAKTRQIQSKDQLLSIREENNKRQVNAEVAYARLGSLVYAEISGQDPSKVTPAFMRSMNLTNINAILNVK